VHGYLLGEQSFLGTKASPYWVDLAEVYAEKTATTPEHTLDLVNNPRWKGTNPLDKSERTDKISWIPFLTLRKSYLD